MSLIQRVKKILTALFTVLCAAVMLYLGEDGYVLVTLLLSLSLIAYGVKTLIYYFIMARHMVDGRAVFFRGVIVLDFGLFTLSATDYNIFYVVIYLLGIHVISGVMSILYALEERHFQAASWRLSMADGIVNIAFAVTAVIFGFITGNLKYLTWVYAAGLLYSAGSQLISAFRKTAIVYIQ